MPLMPRSTSAATSLPVHGCSRRKALVAHPLDTFIPTSGERRAVREVARLLRAAARLKRPEAIAFKTGDALDTLTDAIRRMRRRAPDRVAGFVDWARGELFDAPAVPIATVRADAVSEVAVLADVLTVLTPWPER